MYPGAYVAQFPDKPAVVMAGGGEGLTYRELGEGSARARRGWRGICTTRDCGVGAT